MKDKVTFASSYLRSRFVSASDSLVRLNRKCANALRILQILLVTGLCGGILGCSPRTVEWTEQVSLTHGGTVTIRNRSDYGTRTPMGGPVSIFPREVRVAILDGQDAHAEWVQPLDPLLLDRDPDTGEFVLIATTGEIPMWQSRGSPQPPYWQFRLRDGGWMEEPLADFVFGQRTNLLVNPFWSEDVASPISMQQKQDLLNQHGAIRRYRRIERKWKFGID